MEAVTKKLRALFLPGGDLNGNELSAFVNGPLTVGFEVA